MNALYPAQVLFVATRRDEDSKEMLYLNMLVH
jgi:hypothetical protein